MYVYPYKPDFFKEIIFCIIFIITLNFANSKITFTFVFGAKKN
jgi:hypothetical protein